MKKIMLIILTLILCISFAACKNDAVSGSGTDTTDSSVSSTPPGSYADASVGDIIEFAGHEWFVLEEEDSMIMILSVYLLDEGQYNGTMKKITWAESDIRDSMNDYYLNKAFSDEEIARIVERAVINNDNPWYGTPGGENTEDKLFLLSIEELVKYFGDSGMLSNRPEDSRVIYDDYDDARIAAYERTGIDSWWWLRSPGDGPTQAALVSQFGGISVSGFDVMLDDHFPEGRGGIRPALWLKTDQ